MLSAAPKPTSMKMFRSMFKNGDQIVVITDQDEFFWGKMKIDLDGGVNPGLRLTLLSGIEKWLWWQNIRFMAHTGFPVKQLLGPGADALAVVLETANITDRIRAATLLEFKRLNDLVVCRSCGVAVARDPMELATLQEAGFDIKGVGELYHRCVGRSPNIWRCPKCATEGELKLFDNATVFGDPWLIEDFSATLLNPGARGAAHWAWDPHGEHEEVLVLNHRNGAGGMLWDLKTVVEAA